MRIVAIEANIGAGKSTLLEPLRAELQLWSGEDWQLIIEPVDQDPEFHRLLKEFVANPDDADKRVQFQKYITAQRQELLRTLPDGNYLIERSLFSDLVFSQCYFLTAERPSAHYMDYYYDIKRRLKDYPQIDVVVYLDRDPSACSESISKRAREGEFYPLEVLEDLKRFHDACLPQITREYNTKLITVDLGKNYAIPSVIACDVMEAIYG
ncbi:MAG: deoxynucleoside kinase [Cetobacterium sp.]|uniref:deoxynucleoside kinase n=1 Tax=Cetobacterium sp. TaxID=2071632 RepID=UPI003EE62A87